MSITNMYLRRPKFWALRAMALAETRRERSSFRPVSLSDRLTGRPASHPLPRAGRLIFSGVVHVVSQRGPFSAPDRAGHRLHPRSGAHRRRPAPTLAPMTKAAFSEELTERTFRYFWDTDRKSTRLNSSH